MVSIIYSLITIFPAGLCSELENCLVLLDHLDHPLRTTPLRTSAHVYGRSV